MGEIILEMKDLKERIVALSLSVNEMYTYMHRCYENIGVSNGYMISLSEKLESVEANIMSLLRSSEGTDSYATIPNPEGPITNKTNISKRKKNKHTKAKRKSTIGESLTTNGCHSAARDVDSADLPVEPETNKVNHFHVETELAGCINLVDTPVHSASAVTDHVPSHPEAVDVSLDTAPSLGRNHQGLKRRWRLMLRCLQIIILVTIAAEYVYAHEIDKEHQGPQLCGGHLKGPVGTITTPNFPNPFPVPIKCKWIIKHGIENGTISVYFTQQYTTTGLTFTEYLYYDESYVVGKRRALTLTDDNITKVKWLQQREPNIESDTSRFLL
ncbi:unnamed protein product [Spodoptera littoralis]|uniref:CUB domain-containing protein n=1 Tax=Spodoptera littoralis TaxID=7109 RepID=A0A9P0HYJ0_SPOLI|nr:unnamed protein product [Spodoptera littoralis]CAH1637837.1 unnamed protein product [Spodoptera littoralis]